MGPERIHHSSHHFATQSSHSVDRAGWQAKMASIEFGYHDVMRTSPIVSWQLEFRNLLLSSFLLLSSSLNCFLRFSDAGPMVSILLLSPFCLFCQDNDPPDRKADTHEKPRRLFAFQEQMVRPTESGLQLQNNMRQLFFFFFLLSTNFLTVRACLFQQNFFFCNGSVRNFCGSPPGACKSTVQHHSKRTHRAWKTKAHP